MWLVNFNKIQFGDDFKNRILDGSYVSVMLGCRYNVTPDP